MNWLVVLTILQNMSSSMGRMTSHVSWKIKNVPNHQPVYIYVYILNIVMITTIVNIIIYFHILVIMIVIKLEYNGYYLQYHYNHPSIMWVKQCHKSPMTGNGKHTIFKNGDLGVGL